MRPFIALLVLFGMTLSPTQLVAQDINQCVTSKPIERQLCDSPSSSAGLAVDLSRCSMPASVNVCFELVNGKWSCVSDFIYPDEGEYIFSMCNSTGNFTIEACSENNSCGAMPAQKFVANCGSGKTVGFFLDILPYGVFKIYIENKRTLVLKKSIKDAQYDLEPKDLHSQVCQIEDSSHEQVLMKKVREFLNNLKMKKTRQCEKTTGSKECARRYLPKEGGMAGVGVRG